MKLRFSGPDLGPARFGPCARPAASDDRPQTSELATANAEVDVIKMFVMAYPAIAGDAIPHPDLGIC